MANAIEQLREELAALRARLRVLEQTEANHGQEVETLRASEALFRKFVEGAHDLAIQVDTGGRFLYVNSTAGHIFGLDPQACIGQSAFDFVHPDDRMRTADALHEWARDRVPSAVIENRQISQDGTVYDILWAVSLHLNEAGEVVSLTCIGRDITNRKQMEAALRSSEEHYRQLFDGITDVCFVIDRKWRYVHVNQAAAHVTRRNENELIGRRLMDIFPGIENTAQFKAYQQVMETGKPHYFTAEAILPDSLPGAFEAHVYPVPEGILCIARDITERKRAEAAEREQRALAEALRDSAAVLNSTLDLDEVLERILVNIEHVVPHDAASIILVESGVGRTVRCRGYAERGVSGEAMLALRFPVADTPDLRQMAETRQSLVIPDVKSYSDWVERPETIWVGSCVGAPILLGEQVIGFINLDSATPGAFTASHADRLQAFADQAASAIQNARLYEAIQRHAAALEARNQELDAFSYTVAHDLKGPLHIIVGFADLLSTNYTDEMSLEVRTHLRSIVLYAQKMRTIISNLLLLAQLRSIEEGMDDVAIPPLVQAALERNKDRIEEQGITVEVASDLPPVLGHGPWLEEVFTNLIDNAIKYIGDDNPAPRIAIRGVRQGGMVRYEVEDNGIGIEPGAHPHLFEMGTRFHPDQAKGQGLGLSIVQRIVTKLNGEVGVESVPGEGSTFWFALRAPEDDQAS